MSIRRSLDLLLVTLLASTAAVPAWSADEATAAQRRRIAEERAAVEARAKAGQAACAEQFAVTACVDRVKAERRENLLRLDGEVAMLDAEDRRRRAAQRLLQIEQRQAASAQTLPTDGVRPHSAEAVETPARDARSPSRPRATEADRQAAASAADARAAQRAAASARRASEAEAHRAAVEARNRERENKRPPAKPLPSVEN
jgi:colicin import membrane protein